MKGVIIILILMYVASLNYGMPDCCSCQFHKGEFFCISLREANSKCWRRYLPLLRCQRVIKDAVGCPDNCQEVGTGNSSTTERSIPEDTTLPGLDGPTTTTERSFPDDTTLAGLDGPTTTTERSFPDDTTLAGLDGPTTTTKRSFPDDTTPADESITSSGARNMYFPMTCAVYILWIAL